MKTVLFRCDGSSTLGFGHVNRCLVLAATLKKTSINSIFIMPQSEAWASDKVIRSGHQVISMDTVKLGFPEDVCSHSNESAQAIIVDSYLLGEAYCRAWKEHGLKVAVIDDVGGRTLNFVDVLLNQNPGSYTYSGGDNCQILQGPRYALLREEFLSMSPQVPPPEAEVLLLTFGSSDPKNVTEKVLRQLVALKSWSEVRILVGKGFLFLDRLKAYQANHPEIQIIQDPLNVAQCMHGAHIAVTSASSTCYELSYLGVPFVSVICADNQIGIATHLERLQVAPCAGDESVLDEDMLQRLVTRLFPFHERACLSQRARELVDGRGALRCVQALLKGNNGSPV